MVIVAAPTPEPENKFNFFMVDGKLIRVENINNFINALVYTNKNSTYNKNVN
jgi:hypothetical protein